MHAMNHEHPANMPSILRRVTGVDAVKMVGVEGVLAGGFDKMVNDLQGDAFEVSYNIIPVAGSWLNVCCIGMGAEVYGG